MERLVWIDNPTRSELLALAKRDVLVLCWNFKGYEEVLRGDAILKEYAKDPGSDFPARQPPAKIMIIPDPEERA